MINEREIKFRAWDKITKQMCIVWDIGFKGWDFPEETINYVKIATNGTEERDSTEVDLLQYTGLKDKNGKEIYESDLIKVWDQIWIVKFGPYNNYLMYEDNVSGNGFYLQNKRDVIFDMQIYEQEIYEIIGNIHENPELLTAEIK